MRDPGTSASIGRFYTYPGNRCSVKGGRSTIPRIEFSADEGYRGEGISQGLARGILVFADGRNITGEGMGIGAVAIKGPRFSCFARTCTTSDNGAGIIVKTFLVDSRLLWGRGNSPSIPLTRFLEHIAGWYMRWPALQSLFHLGSRIRRGLGVRTFFVPVPPVAEAKFLYQIAGNKIDVSCTIRSLGENFVSAVVLNELAADTFTHGFSQGETTDPPSGWVSFEPGIDLYDPAARLRFCLSCQTGEGSSPKKVWWGREHTRDHRWCGFEIEIPWSGITAEAGSCSYEVVFRDGESDRSA